MLEEDRQQKEYEKIQADIHNANERKKLITQISYENESHHSSQASGIKGPRLSLSMKNN